MKKPNPDQIEISVFGPGYGECILLHLGSGRWVIIDCCLDDDGNPAPISYLKSIGVPPQSVVAIAVSHWHDDHIKGISKAYEQCSNARLSLGSSLTRKEFIAFLMVHDDQPIEKLDRGGSELLKCLKVAADRTPSVKPLSEDTIVVDFDVDELDHRKAVELRALSPSGKQYGEFLERIGKFKAESIGNAKSRIIDPGRNDISVAMLLTIGDQALLLGADLEELEDEDKGWKAVINERRGRKPLAHIHKIPHHGSEGAHNPDVWTEMLEAETFSVVTPWRLAGNELPQERDIERIKLLSKAVYLTSSKRINLKNQYSRETNKLIKGFGLTPVSTVFSGGRVTLRWTPPNGELEAELHNDAIAL